MVTLEVYTKSVKVRYKAFALSKATFVSFCCVIMSLVLPFILCYGTGGFWQKWDIAYEQPTIKFIGKYLFLATTSSKEHPISCSSFSYYSKFTKLLDKCINIKIREIDKNFDRKPDSLDFTITAKVPYGSRLTSLHLILPLNYSLQSPCDFQRQSAIIYQQTITGDISRLSVYGDLLLHQAEPLKCSKDGLSTNSDIFIFDSEENDDVEEIISKYMSNKIRTTMQNIFTTFISTKEDTFTIKLLVNYPEHMIYYKPNLWQVMKFAWMQYLAVYIITALIIFRIKKYIFENNLVLLYEVKTNK